MKKYAIVNEYFVIKATFTNKKLAENHLKKYNEEHFTPARLVCLTDLKKVGGQKWKLE